MKKPYFDGRVEHGSHWKADIIYLYPVTQHHYVDTSITVAKLVSLQEKKQNKDPKHQEGHNYNRWERRQPYHYIRKDDRGTLCHNTSIILYRSLVLELGKVDIKHGKYVLGTVVEGILPSDLFYKPWNV